MRLKQLELFPEHGHAPRKKYKFSAEMQKRIELRRLLHDIAALQTVKLRNARQICLTVPMLRTADLAACLAESIGNAIARAKRTAELRAAEIYREGTK